jgi:DNA-binding response OmpR family regulator
MPLGPRSGAVRFRTLRKGPRGRSYFRPNPSHVAEVSWRSIWTFPVPCYCMLRGVLLAQGCVVEEAPLTPQTVPTEGYTLVLFPIERLSATLLASARAWRDRVPDTALIVAGGRFTQADRVDILEAGVDAYLAKPVVIPELRARVRGALRRFRPPETRLRLFSFGAGTIDLDARTVRAADRDAHLTRTEYEILKHLTSHVNQTVRSGELVKTLWGTDPRKGVHSLRLFIRKLRNKLEPDPAKPRYLVTDLGIGYRLQVPGEAAENRGWSIFRTD